MRVLFVASHPVQYQAPLFRRLAEHPALRMHVAYCRMLGAEAGYDAEFGRTVKWDVPLLDGYPWTDVKNFGSERESFFGLVNPGLWKLIRQGRFDAVVSYTGYIRASFWIALLAAKLSGARYLFGTDTTTLTPRDGKTWKIRVKKFGWPRLFRLADQVIVLSTGGVDLMHSLGIPRDRVTLTPYVVDNDWWKQQAQNVDRDAVRKSWDVPPGIRVVLFCAKLQPWKRPFDLLEAFATASVDNAVLVFAGDGPLKAQLESRASQLGLNSRLRFLGFVNQSQLPGIYTASDLLVLPSEYDAFGLVVNEAFCCGCPVVVSDRVGARIDLVQPGETGEVFPCGDVQALSNSLAQLLRDGEKLRRMGEKARERIEAWSPAENIQGTIRAVAAAVERGK